jgi:hypothetical protein
MASQEEIYRVAVLTGCPGPGRPAYLEAWGGPLGLARALEVASELQETSQERIYCVVPEERLAEETARAEAGRSQEEGT